MLPTQAHARRFALTSILVSAVFSGGCRTIQHIDIDDNSAQTARISATKAINERMFFRADYSRNSAEGDTPTVLETTEDGSDSEINLGTIVIPGPTIVSTEMETDSVAMTVGFNMLKEDWIELRGSVGIRHTSAALTLIEQNDQHYHYDGSSTGPTAMVEMAFPFTERLKAKVGVSQAVFLAGDRGYHFDGSLLLSYTLADHFEIFGGWQNTLYENEEQLSEISLDAKGAVYGVRFGF